MSADLTDVKEHVPTLKDFAAEFDSTGATSQLWTYAEYETSVGMRRELSFQTKQAVIMQLPTGEWSLLVLQSSEHKLFDHARYAVQELFYWYDEAFGTPFEFQIHGMAMQAIVPLKSLDSLIVEDVKAVGTLNGKERKRTVGIRISRKPK